jgi:hypothetical protein
LPVASRQTCSSLIAIFVGGWRVDLHRLHQTSPRTR